MRMVPVDKGIPIPAMTRGGPRHRMYPWASLEIGDSFFVKGRNGKGFSGMAASKGKTLKRKFVCRNVDGGVRVWRVQ